ncbi:MAG: hypothetical protein AAF985_25565 [Bacteroidota bacterium]
MFPIFHLKGYTASDPLDRLSTRQGILLHGAVIFVFAILLIYLIDDVFQLVFFKNFTWKVAEVLLFAGVYAPLFYFLRKSSSLLSYLLILLPLFLVDLYLEAHCERTIANPAIWN